MRKMISAGAFYEFSRERVVSRAGQPIQTKDGVEIGLELSPERALRIVRGGGDVYTMRRQDAYRLALSAHGEPPVEEIHLPKERTQSGRKDVYFRHFHPGGVHHQDGGGGVYFGDRGDGVDLTKS
jgi:hypothetical protein